MHRHLLLVVATAMTFITGFSGSAGAQRKTTAPVSGYQVVRVYPHDPKAFTQGLVFADGVLYEGTGLNGESTLRKVKLENGAVLQMHRLDEQYFGEGIALVNETILQLTYTTGVGFVYERATFQRQRTFSYTGEGWGLAYDGTRVVMSDGTPYLRFLDPTTLKETGRVRVTDGGHPVEDLNELEFVKGELFANVWQSDRIARIDPKTGVVRGWIDLKGILDPKDATGADVLNGIAYDAAGDRLFVTGKLWPKLFEIRVR